MSTIQEKSSTWQLLIGIALAEAGAALVGCGEWDVLKTGAPFLFYAAGSLVFLAGLFLIWKEPLRAMIVEEDEAPAERRGTRKFLGGIDVNGFYLEAYEDESSHGGKRFRLQSFPAMSSEREAAFVRYLIREGLVEKKWPRLRGKILAEAGWAFAIS
jgi:hypothetical protein